VIRVNSQSGKGGIAFLLERDYGLVLPRRLQIEFSQLVQRAVDTSGREMTAADLWALFKQEFLQRRSPLQYVGHHLAETGKDGAVQTILVKLQLQEQLICVRGQGNGPIDAFLNALALPLRVQHYEEHALSQGSNATAIAYLEIAGDSIPGSLHGVGLHANIVTASLLAVLGAINRAHQQLDATTQAKLLKGLSPEWPASTPK
jgi:2-isopropylmalate synthase